MKNRTPLIPLLALALLAAPAFAAEYEISTLEELREFMEAVHVEDFAGDTITLTADIDCERGRFNTGDPEYPSTFRGTFDGGGHVISNFVHAATGSTQEGYGVAMFDFAETGAAILNLTLEGTLPGTASGAYAAPFVLAVESPLGLFMDNCHFRGSVTNYYHAAGLVGFASSGTGAGEVPSVVLTNCTVRGEIVSTWVYTAGGLVAKGTGVQAFDCSVESELHGGRTGGLVGEAYGGSFEGCSFGGTMRPDRETVGNCIQGGLAAETSNAVFRACTSAVGFDSRAAAAGGAAGVTHGSAAFHDCSATVEAPVPYGRFGGFVGLTAGAETFSNCTATMTVDAIPVINPETHQTNIYSLATGGFAGSVASDGALFVDCTASARGNDLKAGFYYNQQPYSTDNPVGSNAFLRCHVVDSTAKEAGFCSSAWNCAFEGCTVRGGTGGAGFVQSAGRRPDDSNSSTYAYEQTSTFTDCSVHGTRASSGFVMIANSGNKNGHTNVFRRCRAGCIYGNSNNSGALAVGFGSTLNKGTLVEDCAAYGIADMAHLEAGFAYSISVGVTVRRCVGAVYPRSTDTLGAGFADLIAYGTTVEDCYAVYAPYASAVEPYDDQAYRYGVQGGFVRRTSIGTNADDLPIVRCFALWPLSEPVSGKQISGSFCGVTPNSTSTNYFEDCYRPAEAAIGSCHNEDAAGVTAFTKAEFAGATAATMPNYDFADTWHAPGGVASSPYLDASVDENGDFWFLAGIVGAEGQVLVNGEAPREAYPAGSVLTVQAVADNPDIPFAGWVGDGFADPSAQTTTYTVKNVSAIVAKFCIPIYTVDDWTNMVHASYESSSTDAYALMNDLDFTDYIASNGWNYVDVYYAFAGKLFGQGHTIRGLVATNGSFTTTRALFSKLANGAEIRDLTIEASNVPGDQNTLSLAGLAASVGSGVTISNCHAVVDWQGVYPANYDSSALASCKYYGLAQTVSGVGIRIVDCTVEGKLAGGTRACGFVGSATLTGGEIARCAVFADVSTLTNRTDGAAAGFAGEITLSGGAVVRECFSAGVVDAAADAAGFAYEISMRDDESQVRDCYSTAEVLSGASQNPAGFACRISDNNDEGGVLPVANCWFGGTVRCRGKASDYYKPYGFAYYLDGDVSFENCAWIEAPGAKEEGTAGVTALGQAASRKAASWPGYDFAGTWSLSEDETTPYFAWSLADGTDFRLFAVQEEGKTITIPETAAPGADAAISAVADDDSFFCGWAGACAYASASENPTTLLADNHRTARCVWGKAIRTRAELAAVTNDLTGVYGLGADIDLAGENWTPIGHSDYTAFAGTIYGQGHAISNLVVDTEGESYAGLFGYIDHATIMDVALVNPAVTGGTYTAAFAGYAKGSSVSGCSVEGADVSATADQSGLFFGEVAGGSAITDCRASGSLASTSGYAGGFAGREHASSFVRCFALGSVTSTGGSYLGGFIGCVEDDPSSFSECFACGSAETTGGSVGGFAGYVGDAPAFTDCYALVDVKGGSYVGGFVGQIYYFDGAVTRCYSAGTPVGSSDVGGFAGRQYRGSPAFTDCFCISDGLPDLGTSSTDLAGIAALDAAGFLDADNFASFHDTGKWTQVDGKTQPFFAWGLQDGKMTLSGSIAGTGDGAITGLGAYEPGTVVQISALPSGSVFLGWTGNAPYADPAAQTTTVPLDNFRIVTAEFGALVTTREQLDAMRNDLGGSYALGKDIDLSDETWTPVGNNSTPFTGSFYAQGHKITGLRYDSSSGTYAGLFGAVKDATIDGIHLEGVSINGRQYTGALAGDVQGATTIRNCSAEGVVSNNYGYAGLLVGRVYGSGTTFDHCAATGTVVAASQDTGGLVGGVYYYPVTFADCDADVLVAGTSGGNKGGFVGSVRDGSASAAFARCAAWGDVVATNNSSNVGGFIGYANKPVSFEDCAAFGDVGGTNNSSNVGGFIGYANKPVSFEDCAAFGDVGGRGSTGGFAGKTESAVATYVRCSASGTVVNWSSSCAGGFVGAANGQNSRFEDCAALGPHVNSTSSQTGGFAGYTGGSGIVFADCSAAGDVRSTSSQTGGFVGYVNASNVLERCVAEGTVSGTSQTGGFVGQANGDRSQYLSCVANGSVAGTGNQAGGFVGQIGSTGLRFAQCSALGGVSDPAYSYVGGFVGQVSNSNDLWRCMCAGAAVGKQYVGGFVGYQYGGNTAIRECFALGDATALNAGDAYAGGFAGDLYSTTFLSDSYCLGTVKGQQKAGGFAGRNYYAATTITRCYAAGVVDCAGTYAGAFLGYAQSVPTFADCAVLAGGFHAIGSNTAGTSTENANAAERDAAGMKDSDNFQTWLAIDDADGSVWTQQNGVTQPYLAWSAPGGKLIVYSSVGGSARGEIEGAGEYAPGATATVTAVPDGGFFVTWTGSTPYADPSSPTTTIALDNHRVAAVQFGKLITTADELDAVRNDLGGIYGLGADIDLLGRPWTPLGDNSKKFTGKFYGFGHEVMNLVATNNPNNSYKGLFGSANGAVLDGITVSGTVRCNSSYYYTGGLVGNAAATLITNCHATVEAEGGRFVGGLVGRIEDGTSILGCSAAGTVKATSNYAYAGGLAGGCEGGTFEIRDSVSSAEVTSTASYLGGFIGYVTGSGASVISGCRADGYVGGNGSVGGFVGYVSAPMTISDCVARGDVRSTGANYGGFVGYIQNSDAVIKDCWCSGAVWGTGGTIGSFIGYKRSGTIQNCQIYAYGAGPRPFCGSDSSLAGGSLTAFQIEQLSADWPEVKKHVHGATKISTAEELFAVTNNLAGIYVLTKDIDLGGAAWTPIGNSSTAFTGEFYGQNHKIRNYVVDTTERYAGLFGRIAGGRVSGVQAEGTVVGSYTGSGSNVGVGGFVGCLDTYSLIDGCSFAGAVTNATTYNAGGFVGYVTGSPVVLRSCVTSATVVNLSSQAYAGGFVGYHSGGYIMDCYAIADVEAGCRRVGGFAGDVAGQITTSYCSGSVTASGSYHGAFAGSAGSGNVTKSYYDSGRTALLAVNNAANDGVAPLTSSEMLHAANFPAFDFLATWKIDEGETTPYLRTFLVQLTGFQSFLEEYGFDADTDPLAVVNGIPLLARYVYGIVPLTATTDNAGNPLVDILIGADGKPWFKLPPQKSADDYGMRFSVLWSRDLVNWQTLGECRFDQDGDGDPTACHPPIDSRETQMFFKYKIVIDD